jgi:AcrR family transcriptional regulator
VTAKSTAVETNGGKIARSQRAPRVDAQRNRVHILEVAEVVLAAEGEEAPIETIAEKAGVGIGTLYRHFPTKQKLCQAVLLNRLWSLVSEAQRLMEDQDPGKAFFDYLTHFVEEATAKRDLLESVQDGFEFVGAEELVESIEVLMRRAQAVGAVRKEVSVSTVISLIGGAAWAAAHSKSDPSELVAIISDGLQLPSGS